ncbi:MAG: glycosyl transferase, partial [Alphaproteobacteria bacterium]|nr:glycosyl transferase [Alphaproteobacteria bacterium]
MIALAAFVAALVLSWAATGAVTTWLRRRAVFDQPNERSSHTVPTPRGGGLGLVAAVLPLWAVLGS